MPPVSVLIPAYRPDYLRQAIASVLAQTFTDYELLISDDCPDDGVKAVVAEFKDPRIRLMEGPRQGLVENSAFLFEQASGRYLKYLYDDDFLFPFAIARLGQALTQAPTASFAFTNRHFVNADGSLRQSPAGIQEGLRRAFEAEIIVENLISKITNFIGEPSNIMIRRTMFENADCLRTYAGHTIRHMIDVTFYLNALDRGPCVGIGEPHAAFRHHDKQMTSKRNPKFSIGVLEWDIFLRNEVRRGRCSREGALLGLDELDRRYGILERNYPELALMRRGVPALRARIEAGERDLLDADFERTLAEAYAIVEARLAERQPQLQAS